MDIKKLEEVFPSPINPNTGEPDDMLFTARTFCVNKNCKYYNAECSDGYEHTWVECPEIAKHEMEMRDSARSTIH